MATEAMAAAANRRRTSCYASHRIRGGLSPSPANPSPQAAVAAGLQRSVKLELLERRLAALLADIRAVPPSLAPAPAALFLAAPTHAAARRRVLQSLGRVV
jgi:uncharacterized Rmd1/YagE family protein